ncbi:hypothetical protein TcCL_Unassigned00863 [Trypanosoma cruzi]|nr:hypothetical protein TcCL_Unassigned00863 [Trypanosoma cruzi]
MQDVRISAARSSNTLHCLFSSHFVMSAMRAVFSSAFLLQGRRTTPTAPCTRRPLPFVSPAFPPPSSRAAALPGEGVPVLGPAGVFFRAVAPRASGVFPACAPGAPAALLRPRGEVPPPPGGARRCPAARGVEKLCGRRFDPAAASRNLGEGGKRGCGKKGKRWRRRGATRRPAKKKRKRKEGEGEEKKQKKNNGTQRPPPRRRCFPPLL